MSPRVTTFRASPPLCFFMPRALYHPLIIIPTGGCLHTRVSRSHIYFALAAVITNLVAGPTLEREARIEGSHGLPSQLAIFGDRRLSRLES